MRMESWRTGFQIRVQFFIGHASFFHIPLCLFAKIAFCIVQSNN